VHLNDAKSGPQCSRHMTSLNQAGKQRDPNAGVLNEIPSAGAAERKLFIAQNRTSLISDRLDHGKE